MSSRSANLIEFLLSLSETNLETRLLDTAAIALIDNIGCGLYGAHQPWGVIVNKFVLYEGSQGNATLFGTTKPVSPARAALANGTSTHGFEFDDTLYAQSHPGAVVIPAALAAAEHTRSSGKTLLIAIIAGYEAMGRLVQALGIDHGNRGYHTTGVAGPIAAAVAAGIIMQLNPKQLLAAIGNACSSSSGIKAFTQGTGGMTKRMHAGRAAESGVLACQLAKDGFTGPLEAIDGSFGLLQVIGASGAHAEYLDEGLGASFAIDKTCVKVYPSCAVTHSAVHALESLKKAHQFTPGMVKEIKINTSNRGVVQNGGRNPVDTMAAQYSLPYCAGVAVAKNPRDPLSFAQSNLADSVVNDLASKTVLVIDEEIDRIYPTKLGARVEVSLMDGRAFEETVLDPRGSNIDPCTPQDIEAKFRDLMQGIKSPSATEQILHAVRKLRCSSLDELSSSLRAEF